MKYGGRTKAYTTIKPNGMPRNADTVLYSKKINGTYYVVQAVPVVKAKTLYVVSAYLSKKGAPQLSNANSPAVTSETASVVTPSTQNNVTQALNADVSTPGFTSENVLASPSSYGNSVSHNDEVVNTVWGRP